MTFAVSALVSALLAGIVKMLSPWLEPNSIVPLYIGCATLPNSQAAAIQFTNASPRSW